MIDSDRYQLFEDDCLGPCGMARLADASVDHIIADPQYCAHVHRNFGRESRNDGTAPREAITFPPLTEADAGRAAEQMVRVARRWILLCCDEFSLAVWRKALVDVGGEYVRFGLWIKTDAMPQMSGDSPATPAEHICIAHVADREGRKRWNRGGGVARWNGPCQERRVDRDHPTQKPEWLMEALVRDFTDPGELILDPFAGSGTTGVACIRNGRRFVGFERDPKYAAIARKRLSAAREQPGLFGPRPAKPKQGALLP